jgi:nicotinamidase-related amidase
MRRNLVIETKNGLISIPAKFPEADPLLLDPAKSCVVVIDMQEEFLNDLGAFGDCDRSHVHEIIPATAQVLDQARRTGLRVIYTRQAFLPDLADAGTPGLEREVRMNIGGSVSL